MIVLCDDGEGVKGNEFCTQKTVSALFDNSGDGESVTQCTLVRKRRYLLLATVLTARKPYLSSRWRKWRMRGGCVEAGSP